MRTLPFLLLPACTFSEPSHEDSAACTTCSDSSDTHKVDTSSPPDSGTPNPAFPHIIGDCGTLDSELSDDSPHLATNTLTFDENGFSEDYLSEEGLEILETDNAGGSSVYSEVFAFEVLLHCEEAKLLKTETQIQYQDPSGKMTDLLVEIDSQKIGVSVTRAFAYPPDTPYTEEMASSLLEKKLSGVLESSANVSTEDRWKKQVLHVLAYTEEHSSQIVQGYQSMDDTLKADTILLVTTTEGEDSFLY